MLTALSVALHVVSTVAAQRAPRGLASATLSHLQGEPLSTTSHLQGHGRLEMLGMVGCATLHVRARTDGVAYGRRSAFGIVRHAR